MKRFYYAPNHKADEAYMARMCHEGWAAAGLVEGIWTFEPCEPDKYVFRVAYLRGMSKHDVDALKGRLAAKGIEFVSRYSFWAIFRSEKDFVPYTPDEEKVLCQKILKPMILGSVLSWCIFAASVILAVQKSPWFCLPAGLIGLYALICTLLGVSYSRLIKGI